MTKELTIDIDTPYEEYVSSREYDVLVERTAYIPGCEERYIRKSASGRVHVKLIFTYEFSYDFLMLSFCIRGYLGDDALRIRADLDRLYRTRDLTKQCRCFDEKYRNGELMRAGEWLKF